MSAEFAPPKPAELPVPFMNTRRDWKAALVALRKLLADGNDTVQVFRIMRALNAGNGARNYHKLLEAPGGGRIAYRRTELAELFSDPAFIASFKPGTVGAAYRDFLNRTGYSAMGLAEVANSDNIPHEAEHPYAWFGRRERDIHDIWHVLTGYQADEPLGEACLVAFSFAQTKGLGWAAIALGASLKARKITGSWIFAKAVIEGYRHGKRAEWLSGQDYEQLMHEPIAQVRRRLKIGDPVRYREAQAWLAARGFTGL
ncbi:ubiquinone biosynthesis protein [Sphingomonas sp. ID1715]|uniref:Coq4 family protein n=1 Tax=Sphingomonas sp. ID1715 TaxID=1656898 RepID=UPI001489A43C|nr:Coq4 family protein [Sphingomonas sp. ID1715]NNM78258.1 ubiquinone biosynthesis protein [Sphingomonas sp. ID1715]